MLLFFSGKGDEKRQTTINKMLDLPNLPSHEPQPSTSTSKAPESDTLSTTSSPCNVEGTPLYDSELIETCPPRPKKRQLSIVQSMERKYSYSDGGKDYLKLCKCLLYFICVDKRPFDIVKTISKIDASSLSVI